MNSINSGSGSTKLIDESSICRICLLNTKNLNLFNSVSDSVSYFDKLKACVPWMNISRTDNYSHSICTECSQLLDRSYEFHQLCIESDKKLRQREQRFVFVKIETKDEPEPQEFYYSVPPIDNLGEVSTKKNRSTGRSIKNRSKSKHIKEENAYKPVKVRKNAARYDENGKYIKKVRFPKYKCDYCGKMMFGKIALEQHIRIHTGERPYVCEICGKSFVTEGCVKGHIKLHNKNRVKKFKCNLCKYETARSSHYKLHVIIHTGEYPFECDICGKRSNTKSNLGTHIRNIHTEPDVKCEFCGEMFRTVLGLRRHIIRHYRSLQYECPQCKNVYANHRGLIFHVRRHHPDMKRPTKQESCVVNTENSSK